MNPASLITRNAYKSRLLPVSPAWFVLAIVLFPAIVLFCYNWNSPAAAVVAQGQQSLALRPRVGITTGALALATGLTPVANPRFAENTAASGQDPFAALSRDMITAAADPFLYALASGTSEGKLVVTGYDGTIPVYGPPVPRLRYRSDADMLRMLSSGVGGSFRNFFSNVFGENAQPPGSSQDVQADGEENPFRRARESAADATSVEPEAPAETTDAETATQTEAPSNEQSGRQAESAADNKVSAGSVDVWRPGVMMRVGEQGLLESVYVSHPGEHVLESAEFGLRDFDLLKFPEPSELPVSLAVADFNADGRADVAVQTAYEGMVRLFVSGPEGGFQEQLRVRVGTGTRSIAAADFDGNGLMDLAISSIGTGPLTVLFGESQDRFRFSTRWVDVRRDYIAAATGPGTRAVQLLGVNFAGGGTVLLDFSGDSAGSLSGVQFAYQAVALDSTLRTTKGWWPRLNAVVLNSGLSLNIDSRSGGLSNVVNVSPGADTYLVAGDLDLDGTLTVAVARKR